MWEAPAGGGPVMAYVVTGEPESLLQRVPPTEKRLTIRNLTNGTKYRFVVTAENAGGSASSDQTLPLVPAPLTTVIQRTVSGTLQGPGNCRGYAVSGRSVSEEVKLNRHDMISVTTKTGDDAALILYKPDGTKVSRPSGRFHNLAYEAESDGRYILEISPRYRSDLAHQCEATAQMTYTVARHAMPQQD
ncbi:MAG: fibronectin type III domain-containing protein [Chloroflexi bacterium]|nr:fibronectin type III domain-containing protein [Chloroflexota bacterium]